MNCIDTAIKFPAERPEIKVSQAHKAAKHLAKINPKRYQWRRRHGMIALIDTTDMFAILDPLYMYLTKVK